jgi:hypothetical protein
LNVSFVCQQLDIYSAGLSSRLSPKLFTHT